MRALCGQGALEVRKSEKAKKRKSEKAKKRKSEKAKKRFAAICENVVPMEHGKQKHDKTNV